METINTGTVPHGVHSIRVSFCYNPEIDESQKKQRADWCISILRARSGGVVCELSIQHF